MNTKFFHNIIWGIVGLITFVPIFLNISVNYPFVVVKTSAFRFLVLTAFSILLYIIFLQKENRVAVFDLRKNKILGAWLLLLAAFGLSAIFGVDSYNSFWSGAERMMGIISWVSFFLLYILLVYVMASNKSKQRTFKYLVLIGAGIVSLSAIIAYFNGSFLPAFKGQRLTGLSGNPSYLAVYMLFASFLALSLAFEDYEKNNNNGFVFWILGFLYFSSIVFGTGTRGAMLGWGVGSFGILTYLIFKYKKNWIGRTALVIVILGIISVGTLFTLKNTNFVKHNLALSRLTSISASDTTAQSRLFSYRTALKAWPQKPIFGWGLENYKPAFLHNFIPDMVNNNPDDVTFDKTHNMPLEILTTTGIVGFIAYIYFFYIAFRSLAEKIMQGEISKTVAIILGAGLLGYFVSNLFLFDVFESLFMMAIFLALFTPLDKLILKEPNHNSVKPLQPIIIPLSLILIATTIGIIYTGVFLPYKTSYDFAHAKKSLTSGDANQAYIYLSSATSQETLSSRDSIADFLKPYIQKRQNLSNSDKTRLDALIRNNLEILMKRHPAFLGGPDNLVYFLVNRPDATSGDILEAETLETQLVSYAPNYLSYRTNLAFIYGLTKDYSKATTEINYVLSKTDKLAQPYWYKGIILNMKGDKAEALDNFALAIQKGYAVSAEELNVLIEQSIEAKRYDYLIIFYTKAIDINSKNLQNYASLASAYQKIGDYANARITAQKMLELDPSLKPQVDAFLKTLPSVK